jgi:hypothetical protein
VRAVEPITWWFGQSSGMPPLMNCRTSSLSPRSTATWNDAICSGAGGIIRMRSPVSSSTSLLSQRSMRSSSQAAPAAPWLTATSSGWMRAPPVSAPARTSHAV